MGKEKRKRKGVKWKKGKERRKDGKERGGKGGRGEEGRACEVGWQLLLSLHIEQYVGKGSYLCLFHRGLLFVWKGSKGSKGTFCSFLIDTYSREDICTGVLHELMAPQSV